MLVNIKAQILPALLQITKSDGLFLLHTIVRSSPTLLPDMFVLKYIFQAQTYQLIIE